MSEHAGLNSGLGEGVSYRGELMIAVRCQITDLLDVAPSEVEVDNAVPIQEVFFIKISGIRTFSLLVTSYQNVFQL